MSQSISVAIKGPDAELALVELLSITGIEGEVRPREDAPVYRDAGAVASIGDIIGLVGGIVSIVSNIILWREKWKKAHENQRLSVVIQDARGNRLSLDTATPEQITEALQTLVVR